MIDSNARRAALLALVPALAACGNTITNAPPGDRVVGPPIGAPVTVVHGDDQTQWRLEGTLADLGENWVGVELEAGRINWVPARRVFLIEQRAE